MKEKDFWLTKKWLGAAVFTLFCLCYSLYLAVSVNKVVSIYVPIVKENTADFLPVTFENGMIVKPVNTVIERTYGSGDGMYKIVLDTRTEEFEQSLLKESGLYISRAAIYSVNAHKNEIRINNFREVPNMVIDQEVADTFLDAAEGYIIPVVLGICFFSLLIMGLVIMGIYSLVLHWIMSALYKAPYGRTLRVTVYSYVALEIVCLLAHISYMFWGGFVVAGVMNIIVNQMLKKEQQPTAENA